MKPYSYFRELRLECLRAQKKAGMFTSERIDNSRGRRSDFKEIDERDQTYTTEGSPLSYSLWHAKHEIRGARDAEYLKANPDILSDTSLLWPFNKPPKGHRICSICRHLLSIKLFGANKNGPCKKCYNRVYNKKI